MVQILAEVAPKVAYLKKQGENEAQGYSYARAEDVFRRVNEELSARGVSVVKSTTELVRFELVPDPAGKKKPSQVAVVRITQTYGYSHQGGALQECTFQGLGGSSDSGDKAIMKANTAALKYLLTAMFNISWGDDPEAFDPETGESTGGKATKRAASGTTKKPAAQAKPLAEIKQLLAAADLTVERLKTEIKPKVQALTPGTPEYQEAVKLYKATQERIGQTTLPGTN